MSKELVKRILSSIILIPLAFYFILHGSFMLLFFTTVCFFVASYEWHMMTKKKPYYLYGFIFLAISFFTFYKVSIDYFGVFFSLSM